MKGIMDFHKGDKVKVSWGEIGTIFSDPKPGHFNLIVWFNRRAPAPTTHHFSPNELTLIRRKRKAPAARPARPKAAKKEQMK